MSFLFRLLSLLIPPRATERTVVSLRHDELRALKVGGALPYADPRVKALVWELKYHRSRRALGLAAPLLAEEVLALIGEEVVSRPLLVPVPMHRRRRRLRGYNHTELLCKAVYELLPETSVEYVPRLLRRHRDTARQVILSAAARRGNVQDAFSLDEDTGVDVIGQTCILLDDVQTTGATLREAAKALRNAGARTVEAVVLAH